MKLFYISDITKVKKLTEKIIKKKNKVSGGEHDGTAPEVNEDEDLNAVEDIKPEVVKIEKKEEDEDIFEDGDNKEIKPEQANYDSIEDEAEYDGIKNEEEVLEIESNQETENLNDKARVDESDIENNDNESIGSDPLHWDVEHYDVEHDFNEMKKQGTVAEISSWVQGKDEHQLYTLPVNYMEMQYWEESEGAVFLL